MTANEIRLACWDCNAIYASPKDKLQCPNCGWEPTRLVHTADSCWADPAAVVIGRCGTADDAHWVSHE